MLKFWACQLTNIMDNVRTSYILFPTGKIFTKMDYDGYWEYWYSLAFLGIYLLRVENGKIDTTLMCCKYTELEAGAAALSKHPWSSPIKTYLVCYIENAKCKSCNLLFHGGSCAWLVLSWDQLRRQRDTPVSCCSESRKQTRNNMFKFMSFRGAGRWILLA